MTDYFNSNKIDELFSETALIRKYIDVAKALAVVQGNLGLIPKDAANAINTNMKVESVDLKEYRKDFEKIGFPIVGLIKQLNRSIPDHHGEYLHWGATTQDIMDTGLVLILKDFIELFQEQLDILTDHLTALTTEHLETLMVGRSQLQQAIPITFGYKTATWLAPILRHKKRLEALPPNLLKVQFGGAVGTLASLGEVGIEVRKGLAANLGLHDSEITWHTQRDQLAAFMSFLGVVSGSISKIGQDILLMTQTEVAELIEKGGGKSSTMPNKRNPIRTQNVLLGCKFVRGQMQSVLDSMVQDHERGSAVWQMEWKLIPDICSQIYFAVSTLNELFENIEVNKSRMLENINHSGTMIYAEAIMMIVAQKAGRQVAHDLIDDAVSKSLNGISFEQALKDSKEIMEIISEDELKEIFLGKQHIKMGALMANQVLKSMD